MTQEIKDLILRVVNLNKVERAIFNELPRGTSVQSKEYLEWRKKWLKAQKDVKEARLDLEWRVRSFCPVASIWAWDGYHFLFETDENTQNA